MRVLKIFFAVLLLCGTAGSVFAQETGILLQAGIDKRQITIGDRVVLSLEFSHPAGVTLQEPAHPADLGAWTVREVRRGQEKKQDRVIDRLDFTLVTFTTGPVTIPEIAVRYLDAEKMEKEIKSAPIPVTVESVLAQAGNSGDIRDVKPPLRLPVPLTDYLWWMLAFAALAGAAFWWYRRYRKQARRDRSTPPVPERPPLEVALEALQKLRGSGLIAEGRIKEFYIALADIIRTYIAGVYGMETRDRTTAELCSELRPREPDKKVVNDIKDFFEECDLVKFAKYRPDEATCWQDWERADMIVKAKMENQHAVG